MTSSELSMDEVKAEVERIDRETSTGISTIKSKKMSSNATRDGLVSFSKSLPEQNLSMFSDIVQASQSNWDEIHDALEKLEQYVGSGEVLAVKRIHNDYWSLLLKTNRVISLLTRRSRIRQRYVNTLLDMLGRRKSLTADEKVRFHTCMKKTLQRWANQELTDLMDNWKAISDRLLEREEKWQSLTTKATATAKIAGNTVMRNLGMAVGGLALLAGGIALVVLTAGLALPLELAFAGTVTSSLGLGLAAHSLSKYKKDVKTAFSFQSEVELVRNKLKEMQSSCKNISRELNNTLEIVQAIDEEVIFCEDTELQDMVEAVESIQNHLKDFEKKGKVTCGVVEAACSNYLKRYE